MGAQRAAVGGRPALHRTRAGGAADLLAHTPERAGDSAYLPASGRHPAGDRTGGGANQTAVDGPAGGAVGRLFSPTEWRQPDGPGAPPDLAGHDRLELCAAVGGGAHTL